MGIKTSVFGLGMAIALAISWGLDHWSMAHQRDHYISLWSLSNDALADFAQHVERLNSALSSARRQCDVLASKLEHATEVGAKSGDELDKAECVMDLQRKLLRAINDTMEKPADRKIYRNTVQRALHLLTQLKEYDARASELNQLEECLRHEAR